MGEKSFVQNYIYSIKEFSRIKDKGSFKQLKENIDLYWLENEIS